MTRNFENSQTSPASRPTAQKPDASFSPYGSPDQEWDPTAPRKEERYSSPSFEAAGDPYSDYTSSIFATGHNPNPDTHPQPDMSMSGMLDEQALNAVGSMAANSLKGKAPKRERLTRSEKKAAKRELARKKREAKARDKELRSKHKSIAAQLKNRDKELSDLMAGSRKARRRAKDVLHYIGYNAMYIDGICEVEEGDRKSVV